MASQQVDKYRRRPVPSYLLQRQSSSIPIYLSQSPLSQAFADQTTIKLRVHFAAYAKQLPFSSPTTVEMEAGLVTSADEVIRNVLRQVHQELGVLLRPLAP